MDLRCVNKKAIESLVRCGALDSTGASRTGMLSVLEHAQGAGAKSQQDAQLGQGSIFDLEDDGHAGNGSGSGATAGFRQELPVPALPDLRADLNAMEKETLGLFLSSHPLKEVRAALRARVDCTLAEVGARRDGDWITVGGMVSELKRIRTRKGEPMMFATLDDLDGQVEILVFNSAYAANAGRIAVDSVLLVRGRVDHKEQGETKVVVHEVEPFEPSTEEVESAAAGAEAALAAPTPRITLDLDSDVSDGFLDELKDVVRHFPGEHELALRVGERCLVLGPDFRVSASNACRADLAALAGPVPVPAPA